MDINRLIQQFRDEMSKPPCYSHQPNCEVCDLRGNQCEGMEDDE